MYPVCYVEKNLNCSVNNDFVNIKVIFGEEESKIHPASYALNFPFVLRDVKKANFCNNLEREEVLH